MSTGRGRGAEKWISTLRRRIRIRIRRVEMETLESRRQFLGAMTAPCTHLGLSELVTMC